jgi:hypothetical protein
VGQVTRARIDNLRQVFSVTGRDADGYDDIYRIYFLVNTTPTTAANGCHGFYDRNLNAFFLYDDALKVAMGPLYPGSQGVLENSRCIVQGRSSSLVSASGTEVDINLGLQLKGAVSSDEKVYFWVKDEESHETGWLAAATWKTP